MIQIPIFYNLNKLGLTASVKELKKLSNQTKAFGLTSTLSIGAATAALTAYTKKALTAAIADQRAQASLAQTLKNLGQAYATDEVTRYIDALQRATGTSEDLLRPAFERLVRATGDITEAQKLLNLTLDLSAATGKTVSQTSFTLTRAYNGQLTSLKKLGINLSEAEIKSKDFMAVQSKLNAMFSGTAAVAASTYAGQLNILKVSADEAADVIGIALIESISSLSGQNGIKDLANQMESLAQSTANVITNLGKIAKFGKEIAPIAATLGAVALAFVSIATGGAALGVAAALTRILTSAKFLGALGLIGGIFALKQDFGGPKTNNVANRNENRARAEQAAKAAKDRKLEIADRTKIVKLTKAQAANEKLKRMFDMDAIQLAAALQGKLSKEDEARVKALQALKTEDKNDDIKALQDLEAAKRQSTFDEIARMKSVVEESKKSNAEILADARARIAALSRLSVPTAAAMSVGAAGGTFAPGLAEAQSAIAAGTFGGMGDLSYLGFDLAALGAANMQMEAGIAAQQGTAGPTNLTVNLQGGINVGSTFEFYQTVQTALQELNRAGNSLTSAGS
jgi:hypothetical protein